MQDVLGSEEETHEIYDFKYALEWPFAALDMKYDDNCFSFKANRHLAKQRNKIQNACKETVQRIN